MKTPQKNSEKTSMAYDNLCRHSHWLCGLRTRCRRSSWLRKHDIDYADTVSCSRWLRKHDIDYADTVLRSRWLRKHNIDYADIDGKFWKPLVASNGTVSRDFRTFFTTWAPYEQAKTVSRTFSVFAFNVPKIACPRRQLLYGQANFSLDTDVLILFLNYCYLVCKHLFL